MLGGQAACRDLSATAMTELSKVSGTALKGVGEAMAEKLAKVGLESLQDVLFHLPLRYQDRTRVVPIGHLRPGQDAVVEGTVSGADVVMGKRRSLVVRLQDGTGGLSRRFYQFSNAFTKKLFHILVGGGSIFNHVMQQRRHQRFIVEFHLGQNAGNRYRVRDIGFTA